MSTVWCTRYALTEGITEREVIEFDGNYAQVKWPGQLNGWNLLARGDWYRTQEEALARADRMRRDRIKKLGQQIEKLGALQFTVIPLGGSAPTVSPAP
jgi:hypothetical protein